MEKTNSQAATYKAAIAARKEIIKLTNDLDAAETKREEDHVVNNENVGTAHDGIDAITDAIQMLEGFFGPDSDPSSSARGIDGLLQVTLARYQDTLDASENYETTQADDHEKFIQDTHRAIKALTRENDKLSQTMSSSLLATGEATAQLNSDFSSLENQRETYKAVLKACSNNG